MINNLNRTILNKYNQKIEDIFQYHTIQQGIIVLVQVKKMISNFGNQQGIDEKIKLLIEYGRGEIEEIDFAAILPQICDKVKKVLSDQPILLQLFAPIKVVGSIFGHFKELIQIFQFVGWPSNTGYVFLGNYVDYGQSSLQTIMLLFLYKIKYPTTFFILRGRHEFAYMNTLYGFYKQCQQKCGQQMWKRVYEIFNFLPYAAVVDQKIFLVSGGIGPDLDNLKQIQKIQRGVQIQSEGLECDLIWSEPDKNQFGFEKHIQGMSVTYGRDCLERLMVITGIQLTVRTKSIIEQGFQFMFDKKLINLFSAPNFLSKFNNSAAILSISHDLIVQIQVYIPKKLKISTFNGLNH